MARRARLVWTRPALHSLIEATRFIQADSRRAAARFVAEVDSRVGRLRRFPNSGRRVAEFPLSGLREVMVGDYRIIYRSSKSPPVVQVLALHHGARLLVREPEPEGG